MHPAVHANPTGYVSTVHAPPAMHTPTMHVPHHAHPITHAPIMYAPPCNAQPPASHVSPTMHAPPWIEGMIHTCENITFSQLLLRTVTSDHKRVVKEIKFCMMRVVSLIHQQK